MGFIVGGEILQGVKVKTFKDGAHKFTNGKRNGAQVTEVILHETVTRTAQATIDVLKKRNLGVHVIIDENGSISQHADLLDDVMWHGSSHNGVSVGIEVVNLYEPKYLNKDDAARWTTAIKAPWAVGGSYVVPTPTQAEATSSVVDWLTSAEAGPLSIPQLWPGFQHTQTLAMGRTANGAQPSPGIYAHMYWAHADGAWLVLYCWLRLEVGLSEEEAYAEAIRRATGASSKGIDLSNYFTQNPYLQT